MSGVPVLAVLPGTAGLATASGNTPVPRTGQRAAGLAGHAGAGGGAAAILAAVRTVGSRNGVAACKSSTMVAGL